ncbi:MAG: putative RNA binding motif protein [Olpidium bornovanus]|uniref:RNA binding motif protein n=1 Tax=Olpidium bornovanus TaxID=278681 RepID=A0A8H8DIA0_9FUNG|nr:MAG: putative RNA binding motif protein [Olpidium bornovanus]
MGFGFVEFDSAEHAASAVRGLQGAVLDGHKLQIKVSHRGTEDAGTKKGGLKKGEEVATGKLLVRNVPFEATKKDLRELFGAFGHLKSVRLPSKFAGGHRGFAFVEYLTPSEATNARDNVGAAHLYGRHLVIEPAREGEDDVEAIRERTGKRFARDSLAGGLDAAGRKAKRKKILQGDGDDDERDES